MYKKLQRQILKTLKITLHGILLQSLLVSILIASDSNAQRQRSMEEIYINVDYQNESLKTVLRDIAEKSALNFSYESQRIPLKRKITAKASNESVANILRNISRSANVKFKRVNGNVFVAKNGTQTSRQLEEYFVADVTVSGKVTDENGETLPGASVIVKGTTTGTTTDLDGKYQLSVPDQAVLVFSFVGYQIQEVSVNNQSVIDIQMMPDAKQLEEVVVVGYGTTDKKDLTGAVGTVDGASIEQRSVTNVSNALQGAVAGVSVTRGSSEPGSGNTIRIRGNTTLQGSNSPLIMVDDVPVSSMNDVNPDQIQSITVLKDGAAAAIYGSRAAAGVIIITTKRAKEGVFRLTYSGQYISNKPTQKRPHVGAVQYMQMDNEKSWNDNGNPVDNLYPIWDEDRVTNYATLHAQNPDEYPNTDWDKLMLNESSSAFRHSITVSGGTDRVRTSANFGYEYQDALYDFRNWKRYMARVNNDIKISDKAGAIIDFSYRLIEDNRPIIDPTGRALQAAPIYAARWQDGRLADGKGGDNAYARLVDGGANNTSSHLLFGKVGLYFKPVESVKISVNAAPNFAFTKGKVFTHTIPVFGADDPTGQNGTFYISGHNITSLQESRVNRSTLTTQALVDYDKTFAEYHTVSANIGYEEYSTETEGLRVRGTNFTSNNFPYLSDAPTDRVFDNGTSFSDNAYRSVFGRVSYNFNRKYYLGASLRRDGSSRFASDYRWGNFPAISAAWTISNESFMQQARAISFLKLRSSYGSLGNDRLGNYLHIQALQFSNALISNGSNVGEVRAAAQRFLAVPDITWETTTTFNLGLEVGLLEDKLSLEAEYFKKETTDMLLSLSVPDLVGFDDPTVNVGSMDTKGWELTASWRDAIGGDFNYSVSVNVSDARSVIGNIAEKRLFDGNTLSEAGSEFRELYGLRSAGVFQTQQEVDESPVTNAAVSPGDVKYLDLSGPEGEPDGVINDFDRTFLGSSQPRNIFGGNISASYKRFDFGLVFQGVGKNNFYLAPSFIRPFQESWLTPSTEYAENYWSVNNTEAKNNSVKYPRLSETSAGNNYRFSDFWLMNGAYLRLKNITLGYTLPSSVLEIAGMTNFRIHIAANDLFTIDSLPAGIDPEQASGRGYFITKSFLVGVKASF